MTLKREKKPFLKSRIFGSPNYRIFPKGLTQALAFFDQKRELTPLEKCDFKDFETFRFYSQKRFHFSLQKLVSTISSFFLSRTLLTRTSHLILSENK